MMLLKMMETVLMMNNKGLFFKSLEVSKGVGVGMLLRGKVDTN